MKRGLSVAGRLWLGFGLFFVMLLAACLVALAGLGRINGEIERMVEKDWKKVTLAGDISFAANDVARIMFSMVHGTGQLAAQKQSIEKHRENVIERLDSIEKMLYKPKGKQLIADLRVKREAFAATYPKVLALLEADKKDEAAAFFTANGMPQLDAYVQAVDAFVRFQGDLFNEGIAEARATYADVHLLIVAFIAAAAILAALLSSWIVRSVTRPLGGEPEDAKRAVQRIAEGDLSFEIALRPGDRDSLLAALSGMRDKLRQMLGNIQGDADGVSGAARSLSVSAAQLAASTVTQSEAAASMAAAVEEVTVSIGQVSDSANETHSITGQTGDLSTAGNGVILRTVDEMHAVAQAVETASKKIGEMGASSLQISSIVQVIRDVAEQTNLLALNAAIEAARAGEQGRGFAVVADEVRKLAERTALATTEIGTMIAAIQVEAQDAVAAMETTASRVNQGVLMAEQASTSMIEIQKSSEQARARVNDIAGALHEQKAAGGELSANVERVAQMAEENSAATHEAADTAHRLEQLAASVHAALGYFRLASATR